MEKNVALKDHQQKEQFSHLSLSGKERAKTEQTLICLIRGCIGNQTVVELRNETIVCGRILNCDGFMNLIMQKALFQKANGEELYFEEVHIVAKNIRYVHIPDKIDIQNTIEKQLFKLGKTRQTGSTSRGSRRGSGRARGRMRGFGRGFGIGRGEIKQNPI